MKFELTVHWSEPDASDLYVVADYDDAWITPLMEGVQETFRCECLQPLEELTALAREHIVDLPDLLDAIYYT